MLALIRNRLTASLIASKQQIVAGSAIRSYSAHAQESDADFDSKWESYFRR